MFKIALSPTFWMKVSAEITAPDGKDDRRVTVAFDVQVKRLTLDELNALNERIRQDRLDDRAAVRDLIVGWKDVTDESNAQIEFTPENLDTVLNLGIGTAILQTYYTHFPKARLKN